MSGEKPTTAEDTARGERMRVLRERSGLGSQDAVAAAAGIERTRYVKVESGSDRLTSPTLLASLAKAYGVSSGTLVDYISGAIGVENVLGARGGPVDTRDRYPSKRAAAAALRGLVDEESIAAMLAEEHSGSDKDPGQEFWFERGLWWNRKRQEARKPALDLLEPPPMVGRPKKGRK